MPIDIDARYRDAVQYIWTGRLRQREKQVEAGETDAGSRGDVTGGGHMGALELLVRDLLIEFGINESDIFTKQRLELPGYYRSTKKWDLLVVSRQQLVMAVEFKSIGGSYGNNLNNRTEEALGNATDIWTAYREGRFGTAPRPLLGYLFLLRDEPKVCGRSPTKNLTSRLIPFSRGLRTVSGQNSSVVGLFSSVYMMRRACCSARTKNQPRSRNRLMI